MSKKIFKEPVENDLLNLRICRCKTEGISPKDFRNYQSPIKVFKDISDGSINLKEVLKDQINFKSDLGETKKKIKSQNQKIK